MTHNHAGLGKYSACRCCLIESPAVYRAEDQWEYVLGEIEDRLMGCSHDTVPMAGVVAAEVAETAIQGLATHHMRNSAH